MNDIPGSDDVVLGRQALRDVARFEAHPIGDTSGLSVGRGTGNRRLKGVVADEARSGKGLSELDQRPAAATAYIADLSPLLQLGLDVGHSRDPFLEQEILVETGAEALHPVPHVVVVRILRDSSALAEGAFELRERTDHAGQHLIDAA